MRVAGVHWGDVVEYRACALQGPKLNPGAKCKELTFLARFSTLRPPVHFSILTENSGGRASGDERL